MKNVYRKFISQINKANNVLIERKGQYYYITDTFTALQVLIDDYMTYIYKPEKGIFIDLNDGETYYNGKIEPKDEQHHISELFERTKRDSIDTAYITRFMVDVPKYFHEDIFTTCRIIQTSSDIITVNEEFMKCFDFIDEWKTEGDHTHPIYGESIRGNAIILPLRHDEYPYLTLEHMQDLTHIEVQGRNVKEV